MASPHLRLSTVAARPNHINESCLTGSYQVIFIIADAPLRSCRHMLSWAQMDPESQRYQSVLLGTQSMK